MSVNIIPNLAAKQKQNSMNNQENFMFQFSKEHYDNEAGA